jgi:2-dehydro-3-deoxyphosphogluconate aldolase / (4S)-4-hydroxy-2-oxoglutarate aldolase
MNDVEIIRLISDHRVFAHVRGGSAESALRAAEAAIVGGIRLIEVALATPGGLRVISDLRHRYGDRATIGAGSVMTYEQIDRAVKSGAQYVAMPHTSAPLVETCRRARVPAIIGALTPTEVAAAASMGVPLITLFPASSLGGPEYFKEIACRMPNIRLGAGGGVGPENIIDYFNAGAFAITVGSRLFTPGDLQNENYPAIAERARGMLRLAGVA